MSGLTVSPQGTQHHIRWKWFLALGAVLLVLGIAGLGSTTLLEVTSLMVFGPLLLISSLIQLLIALFEEKGKGKEAFLHFAAAGLEAVCGFLIMIYPLHRVVSLIALMAIFLIVGGLVRLIRSLAMQSRGRTWFVLTGVISLLLGASVWAGWPGAELWIVGMCIALDFIFHGVSWSALALAERKLHQAPES